MSQASIQTFKELLIQAIDNFQLLSKLLEEEMVLLQQPGSTPEALEAITQRKNERLEKIQEDVDQRKLFLEEQGLTADMEGIEAFLAGLPGNMEKAMRQGWNQLVTKLEQVQTANKVNGQLINRATQHFDTLLNAFKASQNKVKVYNPAGGPGNISIPRTLGKA
ncbi:flagella synthesis protein FlgN [Marinospirillum insulare]|uniref:FlgN protein n=1 Tax=Marinospirillum insulare TaxID=217169 RepID=A0ABQ6A123_9GAMM|nr:flagellar protein FlgN [Marinospirillum insulare]GLR64606.1 hypothetical protein GCM10007878_20440 [Marinospirillum insulare]